MSAGNRKQIEDAVKSCYSTWGKTYFREYCSPEAAYPPIHYRLLKNIIRARKVRCVLDAGCGPASFLRQLNPAKIERYGFDLTPEMVEEGQRVLCKQGTPVNRIWSGSVLDRKSFRVPKSTRQPKFDGVVCVGVFPHLSEGSEKKALQNLYNAVAPGGTVVIEARNQFFALFTLNRYSQEFFADELMRVDDHKKRGKVEKKAFQMFANQIEPQFRTELPPLRKGKKGEPGYDQVVSRTHNPLLLQEAFRATGFKDVHILFSHFHCAPPLCEEINPKIFREQSLRLERPRDWRGYFMASSFLVVGTR